MARARMVKPEFFEDAKLATISRDARLLYIGLWVLSDDIGNVRLDHNFLKARLFFRDEDIDLHRVLDLVSELCEIDRLDPYLVDGELYGTIINFRKHQKIQKPSEWRNPGPPIDPSNPQPESHTSTSPVPVPNQSIQSDEPLLSEIKIKNEVQIKDKNKNKAFGSNDPFENPQPKTYPGQQIPQKSVDEIRKLREQMQGLGAMPSVESA